VPSFVSFIRYLLPGWSFDFGVRANLGARLFDVRYEGARIVYELSLQELVSFTGANTPASFVTVNMHATNDNDAMTNNVWISIADLVTIIRI